MTTFRIHTEDKDKLNALKVILKALNIKFDVSNEDEKSYDPEFVKKILKSKRQIKEGKSTKVKMDDLDTFLGL